jgi:hypothetical protein
MESRSVEVDGEVIDVAVGDKFSVQSLLEFSGTSTFEPGDSIVVTKMSRFPDGIYFYFERERDEKEEVIYQFALENKLEDKGIVKQ